jgi:hypothetical protein
MLWVEAVLIGCWPVIMRISLKASSSATLVSAAEPMQQLTTTLVILGTCMMFLYPRLLSSSGAMRSLYSRASVTGSLVGTAAGMAYFFPFFAWAAGWAFVSAGSEAAGLAPLRES